MTDIHKGVIIVGVAPIAPDQDNSKIIFLISQ